MIWSIFSVIFSVILVFWFLSVLRGSPVFGTATVLLVSAVMVLLSSCMQ